MKTLDVSGIEQIASVERIDDQSGTIIAFHLTNGACIVVAPENDGMHYYANGLRELYDGQLSNAVTVLCDTGSGYHLTAKTDVHVGIGQSIKLKVFAHRD